MDLKTYNDYIIKTINNEVNKQVALINNIILEKINTQLQQSLQIYTDPSTQQNKDFISKLINSTLNTNSANPDVTNLVNSYVDMRIGMMTVTNGNTNANVGTILSKLTDEITTLLASDDTFNGYMSQMLTNYLESNQTLVGALDNKINQLVNSTSLKNVINDRLDRELTQNIENHLLGIVTDMTKSIIPKYIDGIANIYVMMPTITILEKFAEDLYGIPFTLVTMIPISDNTRMMTSVTTRVQMPVPTTTNTTNTINPEFITNMISDNIATYLENQVSSIIPTHNQFIQLYTNMGIQISNKPVIYMGVTTGTNDILLQNVVSINEPLDPMVKYVFLYDLLTTNTQAGTFGEIANRFMVFVNLINQIFDPTPTNNTNNTNNMNTMTNVISQESFDSLVTSLWNFTEYITLINTKLVLNRSIVPSITISRAPRFSSDNATIDFLFMMIKLYVDKLNLRLMQSLLVTSLTSDSVTSYEVKQFKGVITKSRSIR